MQEPKIKGERNNFKVNSRNFIDDNPTAARVNSLNLFVTDLDEEDTGNYF